MQDNIYAAPESSLNTMNELPDIQEFYVVSKLKFYILFFSTVGFYAIYWNYKNWKQYKITNNEDLWPVARTIFAIFFTHALFSVIDMRVKERDKSYNWYPNLWATLVIISMILDNVLARIESTNIFINMFIFINVFARGYFVYQAQAAINIACNDPEGASNKNLTWVNFVWIIPGMILFLLALVGTFIAE
jgi:hypothetical protein